jgi:predicted RNase H-like nuclease (RuvC/YqgF family)
MDLARFEVLEKRIKALVESVDHTQAENRELRQQVDRLHQTVTAQQQTLEQVQRERDDLLQVSEAVHVLRQEREVIQQKLRHMLATIEWLETHTAMSGGSQSG